jgi:hypothetical protein
MGLRSTGLTSALLILWAGLAGAQQAAPSGSAPPAAASPKRAAETPSPQDVEPAVNTSATAGTPASSPAPAPIEHPTEPPTPADRAAHAAGAASSSAKTSAATAAKGATAGAKSGKAMDRIELDETQITGNRELPKVLYIVPWKRSELGDLTGKPVNSLLDEVLQPVDRDVFKRENRYYRALTTPDNGAAAPTSAPVGSTGQGAAPGTRDER